MKDNTKTARIERTYAPKNGFIEFMHNWSEYIFNSFDVRSFDTFRNRILHFFDVKYSPG